MPEEDCQCLGAKGGPVVELDLARGGEPPVTLQRHDPVDEAGIGPRLGDTLGLVEGDDVGRRLLDHAEPVDLELPQDGRFPRSRRAGQDEPALPHSAFRSSQECLPIQMQRYRISLKRP